MTRGGLKERSRDERRCLVDGESTDRETLVRFVLSPEGVVVPDILERLEGRGVWVSAKKEKLEDAIKRNAFSRGFKTDVKVLNGLVDEIEHQLVGRVISLIAVARRAGHAISGAEKVSQALQSGEVDLIFQASDGSEREKRNLSFRNQVELRYECLNRQELGMAFAKENVVHAAITGAGFVNRLDKEAGRVAMFRNRLTSED